MPHASAAVNQNQRAIVHIVTKYSPLRNYHKMMEAISSFTTWKGSLTAVLSIHSSINFNYFIFIELLFDVTMMIISSFNLIVVLNANSIHHYPIQHSMIN